MKNNTYCSDLELERRYIVNLMYMDRVPDRARLDPSELSNGDHGLILDTIYRCDHEGDRNAWRVEAALRERGMGKAADVLGGILEKHSEYVGETILKAERLREMAIAREYYRQVQLSAEAFREGRLSEGIELACAAAYLAPDHKEHKIISLRECVEAARIDIEKRLAGIETRIRWGVPFLDRKIGGLPPCQTTIGGSTSAGKSSVLLYIAEKMARRGTRVGIISIEDPDTLWGDRSLAMLEGVPTSLIYASATMGDEALERFLATARKAEVEASRLTIFLAFCIGATSTEVVEVARRMIKDKSLDILFVDYIQAARFSLSQERWDKVISDLSKQLKAVCVHAEIPLVAASQLKRKEGEPHITDLKESGDLENMSDAILLIWKESDEPNARTIGKIGKVKWAPAGSRFEVTRDPSHGMVTAIEEAR